MYIMALSKTSQMAIACSYKSKTSTIRTLVNTVKLISQIIKYKTSILRAKHPYQLYTMAHSFI